MFKTTLLNIVPLLAALDLEPVTKSLWWRASVQRRVAVQSNNCCSADSSWKR